jgi:Flp pilus assembly protein TadG
LRTETATPTQTHTYLLAEPSLPDMFSGQAKLLYVKNENPTFGQRLKNFILKPLKIVAAKASLLNVLRDSAFKDNDEAKKLTTHIKGLGFFEGVSTFKVKDFLVDAALHGSRLASASDTTNNAKKSLAELTGAALNEHLNNPGYMYATLKKYVGATTKGLNEFHSFQANPSAQLSETQIAKINALKKNMDVLKGDSEKSKNIPDEVFTKFSEIYEGLSNRLLAKDLVLSTSNLIDRLLKLNPRSTNLDYFLSFFKPENENILGDTIKAQANIFKKELTELANTLDPYAEDASMRATLEILADEFLTHANNQDQPWSTAEAIKTLNQDLEKAKEEKEKYWL